MNNRCLRAPACSARLLAALAALRLAVGDSPMLAEPPRREVAPGYFTTQVIAGVHGNVAYRTGKKLEWDYVNLRARNAPEADQYIRRPYRKGWGGVLA